MAVLDPICATSAFSVDVAQYPQELPRQINHHKGLCPKGIMKISDTDGYQERYFHIRERREPLAFAPVLSIKNWEFFSQFLYLPTLTNGVTSYFYSYYYQ